MVEKTCYQKLKYRLKLEGKGGKERYINTKNKDVGRKAKQGEIDLKQEHAFQVISQLRR